MKSLLAILTCLIAGCATIHSPQVLTERDTGHEVTMTVGQVIVVELPSNATTGYGWNYRSEDMPVLEKTGSAYMENAHPFGMVGVGGTEIWRFRALKVGRQTLRLYYARAWETGVAPARTVNFTVVVKALPPRHPQ